jgi:hypothetical protein
MQPLALLWSANSLKVPNRKKGMHAGRPNVMSGCEQSSPMPALDSDWQ